MVKFCKRVDFHPRHEAVMGQLARFCQYSGLNPTTDVAIGGGLRPGDIFLPHFSEEPTAVDVSITHALAPSLGLDAKAANQALHNNAGRKKVKYAALLSRHRLNFILFLMSTYGAYEEEDCQPYPKKLGGFYAAKEQVSAAECKDNLGQLLQVAAILTNIARRLLAAAGAIEREEREGGLSVMSSGVTQPLFSEWDGGSLCDELFISHLLVYFQKACVRAQCKGRI